MGPPTAYVRYYRQYSADFENLNEVTEMWRSLSGLRREKWQRTYKRSSSHANFYSSWILILISCVLFWRKHV